MNYEQLLRERSLKVTPQRIGMLNLIEMSGHISIEDLYRRIKKEFSSISLATLYKNLHSMANAEILKEVKIPEQKSRYEIVKEPHAHLLCQKCGGFEDIAVDFSKIGECLDVQSGFTIERTETTFIGLCAKCNDAH